MSQLATGSPRQGASLVIGNEHPALGRSWTPVALSDEVTDRPLRVMLLGQPWVVARLDGKVFAARDRCPHRLAPLSLGAIRQRGISCVLQCKYHGWKFTDDGRCVEVPSTEPTVPIPSRAQLELPFGVAEHLGLVWIAPDDPLLGLPDLPHWDAAGFDSATAAPRRTTASTLQLMDNFVDISHFATVHETTFGTPESARIEPTEIIDGPWSATTRYTTYYRNTDDPLTLTGEHPEVQPHVVEKTALVPNVIVMTLTFPLTDQVFSILYAMQPESATSTRIYKLMTRNDFHGDANKIAEMLEFEDAVLDEDLAILESYDRFGLEVEGSGEIHTRADRMSVAYRRLLLCLVNSATAG
jgi:vanillate O-demethylase monooxygenase subunit